MGQPYRTGSGLFKKENSQHKCIYSVVHFLSAILDGPVHPASLTGSSAPSKSLSASRGAHLGNVCMGNN